MPADFTPTTTAIDGGLDQVAPADAVQVIEYWEDQLDGVQGGEAVLADLGKLKTHLQATPIDTAGVQELTRKLGAQTTKLGANDTDVADLGQRLERAAA